MFTQRIRRTVLLSMTMSAALAALTVCPITVSAAEDPKQEHYKMPSSMGQLMKMDPAQCFKMMDKDNKGYVTKQDFMRFQEELWKRMDKDQNNKVTIPEFTDMG